MNDSTLYVDQDYVAHVEFERIVFGRDLTDGMIVLLEDNLMRHGWTTGNDAAKKARADAVSRWCVVSQLHITPRSNMGALVRFVGIYPDGTARVRTYDESYGWIVKNEDVQA